MEKEYMHSDFVATLGFIQNVISRMATMCTVCKICAITIFTAFIVAGFKSGSLLLFLIIGIITIVMAGMDATYLFRERNYIGRYQELVEAWNKNELKKEDYFKVTIGSLKKHPKNTKGSPLFSTSVYPFYGMLLVINFLAYLGGKCNG